VPPVSAFNVLVNSSRRTINSISISDIRVQLVLAGPVASGDVVTVAYSVSTNALRSVSGWYVLSFSSKPVTNKCLAPSSFTAQKPSTASDIIIKTSQASGQENSDILFVGTGRINIYPNPVNGNLNIDIPEPSDEIRLLRLYDITGKISLETRLEPNVKNLNIPIQINSGTYILKIFQGNRSVFTKKLVVLK